MAVIGVPSYMFLAPEQTANLFRTVTLVHNLLTVGLFGNFALEIEYTKNMAVNRHVTGTAHQAAHQGGNFTARKLPRTTLVLLDPPAMRYADQNWEVKTRPSFSVKEKPFPACTEFDMHRETNSKRKTLFC